MAAQYRAQVILVVHELVHFSLDLLAGVWPWRFSCFKLYLLISSARMAVRASAFCFSQFLFQQHLFYFPSLLHVVVDYLVILRLEN